jgi:hypothetical protein
MWVILSGQWARADGGGTWQVGRTSGSAEASGASSVSGPGPFFGNGGQELHALRGSHCRPEDATPEEAAMHVTRTIVTTLAALLATACATVPADPDARLRAGPPFTSGPPARQETRATPKPRARSLRGFQVLYEQTEFDTITSEVLDQSGNVLGEVEVPDVERDLVGIRFRTGSEAAGFHAHVFVEEYLEIYDLFGFEVGMDGVPRFSPDSDVSGILDYSLGLSVHAGDGDVPVVDSSGNVIGTRNTDLGYVELAGRLGGGVDVHGFQGTAGIQGSVLSGIFDVEGFDDTGSFDGSEVGGYVRVAYRGAEVPILASVQALFGGLSGISLQFGIRF